MGWPDVAALALVAGTAYMLGRFVHRRALRTPDASLKIWDGQQMVLAIRVHRAPSGAHYVIADEIKRGVGL